jgi:prephenate dehydrogenase
MDRESTLTGPIIGRMRVAFLGFGLIAGSVARALRAAGGEWTLAGWSPTSEGTRAAAHDGVLDFAADTPGEAVDGATLVVLAAPPIACLELLDALAGPLGARLGADAVVTDVASTKTAICARARQLGLRFVGGHPMAGREMAGYAASDADLFRDRSWVVVEDGARDDDVALVEQLAVACGARPVRLDAVAHDAAVAAISHLPLVAAAALVEAVAGEPGGPASADWPAAASLAATGWRDATRLARGEVTMATDIASTNADAIAVRVRSLRAVLDAWLAELERPGGPDPDRLRARFVAARERLENAPD